MAFPWSTKGYRYNLRCVNKITFSLGLIQWTFVHRFQPRIDLQHLMEALQEYHGILTTFPEIIHVHKVSLSKWGYVYGWFPLRIIFFRTGTDRKVSFVLEPLVPTESPQDKGNFPVRSCPEENYPEWKPALSPLCFLFFKYFINISAVIVTLFHSVNGREGQRMWKKAKWWESGGKWFTEMLCWF